MAKKIRPPANWVAPSGFCQCGCGEKTKICTASRPDWDQYNGYPQRFIHGHDQRGRRAYGWKGGRKKAPSGYWLIYCPEHPNAQAGGYVLEHRLVWEEAHGRLLLGDQDVHHIDGDRENNAPENLVALTKKAHRAAHAADPEYIAKQSAGTRKRYEDPAERARTSAAIKKWWDDRRGIT